MKLVLLLVFAAAINPEFVGDLVHAFPPFTEKDAVEIINSGLQSVNPPIENRLVSGIVELPKNAENSAPGDRMLRGILKWPPRIEENSVPGDSMLTGHLKPPPRSVDDSIFGDRKLPGILKRPPRSVEDSVPGDSMLRSISKRPRRGVDDSVPGDIMLTGHLKPPPRSVDDSILGDRKLPGILKRPPRSVEDSVPGDSMLRSISKRPRRGVDDSVPGDSMLTGHLKPPPRSVDDSILGDRKLPGFLKRPPRSVDDSVPGDSMLTGHLKPPPRSIDDSIPGDRKLPGNLKRPPQEVQNEPIVEASINDAPIVTGEPSDDLRKAFRKLYAILDKIAGRRLSIFEAKELRESIEPELRALEGDSLEQLFRATDRRNEMFKKLRINTDFAPSDFEKLKESIIKTRNGLFAHDKSMLLMNDEKAKARVKLNLASQNVYNLQTKILGRALSVTESKTLSQSIIEERAVWDIRSNLLLEKFYHGRNQPIKSDELRQLEEATMKELKAQREFSILLQSDIPFNGLASRIVTPPRPLSGVDFKNAAVRLQDAKTKLAGRTLSTPESIALSNSIVEELRVLERGSLEQIFLVTDRRNDVFKRLRINDDFAPSDFENLKEAMIYIWNGVYANDKSRLLMNDEKAKARVKLNLASQNLYVVQSKILGRALSVYESKVLRLLIAEERSTWDSKIYQILQKFYHTRDQPFRMLEPDDFRQLEEAMRNEMKAQEELATKLKTG